MMNTIEENGNINVKYPDFLRQENISQFINNNLNEDGLSLSNLYLGPLIYRKEQIESNFHNRVTLVYLVPDLENEILYMDLFKGRLYEKTTYVVLGVFSFAPFIRKGLTISKIFRLSDLFHLERMPIKEIDAF